MFENKQARRLLLLVDTYHCAVNAQRIKMKALFLTHCHHSSNAFHLFFSNWMAHKTPTPEQKISNKLPFKKNKSTIILNFLAHTYNSCVWKVVWLCGLKNGKYSALSFPNTISSSLWQAYIHSLRQPWFVQGCSLGCTRICLVGTARNGTTPVLMVVKPVTIILLMHMLEPFIELRDTKLVQ